MNPCPGAKLAASSRVTHSVFRKDPDPIATLFCLTSVGAEDPQTEGILVKDGSIENSIRSDAEMTMADEFDILRDEIQLGVVWIDDNVSFPKAWYL